MNNINEHNRVAESSSRTEINLYSPGVLDRLHSILEAPFGFGPFLIVTDGTVWKAVGHRFSSFLGHRPGTTLHVLPSDPPPYASDALVAKISSLVASTKAIPIAVGAGTINDIVKRAAFENGVRYACVPTAPSVDGFTSSGAAITVSGFKTTLECPPPLCVIAEEDILVRAPRPMIASGFGDIVAKLSGGADWIIAEAMGIEAIDQVAWDLAQPAAVALFRRGREIREGEPESVGILYKGLISTGLAMQRYKDSRPASGAEHLLSHTWEMMRRGEEREEFSHGFKVAVGTLITSALMRELFADSGSLRRLIEGRGFAPRPDLLDYRLDLAELLPADGQMKAQILSTIRSKTPSAGEIASRAERAARIWPEMAGRVLRQIPAYPELKEALRAGGCPVEPAGVGLSRRACVDGLRIASLIRRRYTVLDLASELGALDAAADAVFSSSYFGEFAPA